MIMSSSEELFFGDTKQIEASGKSRTSRAGSVDIE
jgi:hypothetical protein